MSLTLLVAAGAAVVLTLGAVLTGRRQIYHAALTAEPIPEPGFADLSPVIEAEAQSERDRERAAAYGQTSALCWVAASVAGFDAVLTQYAALSWWILGVVFGICAVGITVIEARTRLGARLSRAREAFDVFYYGRGLAKLIKFDEVLIRFASENPSAHRIAQSSLVAAHLKAMEEHERELVDYCDAMKRFAAGNN
jgi:hypothetical protein